jgi:hypothetical protein
MIVEPRDFRYSAESAISMPSFVVVPHHNASPQGRPRCGLDPLAVLLD